jgi:REP element-mobilizing transposase RayT
MPRRIRVEFPLAIYHVMARGNARQDIVRDDGDRQQWLQRLQRTVLVQRWELFAFVLMSNHFHLFLRTPEPNLSRGMQRLLSGYATWWARRHRRSGHVFQGRFRAQLIEDESYFWTVSRYLHLNPVRARLVDHPRDWPWSSYRGYDSRRRRYDWVAYDTLLAALQGEFGGADPSRSYRRYVTAGLKEPVASPFGSAWQELALGSEEFLRQVKSRLTGSTLPSGAISPRRLAGLDRKRVYETVLRYYGRPAEALGRRGGRDGLRAVAAYLARRCTDATLREVAIDLGLSRADSVPNLTRRVERGLPTSAVLRADLRAIEDLLQVEANTKHKV